MARSVAPQTMMLLEMSMYDSLQCRHDKTLDDGIWTSLASVILNQFPCTLASLLKHITYGTCFHGCCASCLVSGKASLIQRCRAPNRMNPQIEAMKNLPSLNHCDPYDKIWHWWSDSGDSNGWPSSNFREPWRCRLWMSKPLVLKTQPFLVGNGLRDRKSVV